MGNYPNGHLELYVVKRIYRNERRNLLEGKFSGNIFIFQHTNFDIFSTNSLFCQTGTASSNARKIYLPRKSHTSEKYWYVFSRTYAIFSLFIPLSSPNGNKLQPDSNSECRIACAELFFFVALHFATNYPIQLHWMPRKYELTKRSTDKMCAQFSILFALFFLSSLFPSCTLNTFAYALKL